jgi:hypothetical protein
MAGLGQPTDPTVNKAQADIQSELSTLRSSRDGYSKQNAIADSQAFIETSTRKMMEQIMPSINTMVEASGTSGGAVSGLLKNDAVARAAENAATLGVNAATQYGQISNDQSNIIAGLVEKSPMALQMLLQALNVAKGSVQQGATTTVGNQNTSSTTLGNEKAAVNTQSSESADSKSKKLVASNQPIPASGTTQQTGMNALINSLTGF